MSTYRITTLSKKRLVLYTLDCLRDPERREFAEAIIGSHDGTLTQEGWLMFLDKGALPLRRTPGLHSIEDAWENLIITIERKQADGSWKELVDDLE